MGGKRKKKEKAYILLPSQKIFMNKTHHIRDQEHDVLYFIILQRQKLTKKQKIKKDHMLIHISPQNKHSKT